MRRSGPGVPQHDDGRPKNPTRVGPGRSNLKSESDDVDRRWMDRALELEPESTGAWLNLASLLDHLGRRGEAAEAWARLRELEQ